jgi:hypothetical protein
MVEGKHLWRFRGKPRVQVAWDYNCAPTLSVQVWVISETDSIIKSMERWQRSQRFKVTV